MKEVTKKEYFDFINYKDAVISVECDKYPYTVVWKTRDGKLLAKAIPCDKTGRKYRYYINVKKIEK